MKNKIFTLLLVFCAVQFSTSQNFKFGKVSKEELEEKVHPTEPDANAAILYREYDSRFEQSQQWGFFIVEEVFERIKIYNKEGFDWATKKVNLFQGGGGDEEEIQNLKAYTYYLDSSGKVEKVKLKGDGIFDEERNEYWEVKKFTMPDLKEGCVIEFRYTKKTPFINSLDEYRFQETIPVNELNFKFAAPEYYNYKMHQKGWMPFKIQNDGRERSMSYSHKLGTRSGSVKDLAEAHKVVNSNITFRENIYKVVMQNVPAMKEEPYSGNLDNYSASIKMELSYVQFPNAGLETYATTWEAVSTSIYKSDSFGGQLNKTQYFKDDIDQLLTGAADNSEKMLRIFEYVKNKLNWNKFNSVFANDGLRTAYNEGKGNAAEINLMLTAMFRYAGLNANPILVSTKENGIPIFPTRSGFNFVIAGVEIENEVILFDATNKKNEINILETKLLNWQGRIIREDGSSTWVSLLPTNPAVRSTLVNAVISEDLSAAGSSKNRFTGHLSQKYRSNFELANAEERRKSLEEDAGETEMSNIDFENLTTLYQPVNLTYDFKTFDAVEKIGDKLYFSPILFMGNEENPFKLDERKYPVDFKYPKKDRYMINITIPEGYKVETLPESASFGLERNALNYRYAVSNNGDKLQLSVEYSVNEAFIGADEYASLKKFFELLIEKEKEKVVLSKI
ncbi:transglutaminase domain-containing protein [Ulvibacter antarcticus]|uniref:Uncharacterized protein DUF3857 n=1 Tax=Ulvibacter antarcticus TaxID=442714 RepID=A0A3L9YDS9_9FLAO|nr:DUF3857 domain-containing protein [Ulvibacter antarcticus]RMA57199.1 uncharacterized protein DUF3857 [Ulvibacter antarcticus]